MRVWGAGWKRGKAGRGWRGAGRGGGGGCVREQADFFFLFLMVRPPPNSPLFPSPTLFRSKSAVLLGAGGAARAIGVELLRAGASFITVVNRGEARAKELVAVLDNVAPGKAKYVPWRGD